MSLLNVKAGIYIQLLLCRDALSMVIPEGGLMALSAGHLGFRQPTPLDAFINTYESVTLPAVLKPHMADYVMPHTVSKRSFKGELELPYCFVGEQ